MAQMPELIVDSIQNGKKQFIEKYVKNYELKQAWINYVDTQTKFVHAAIKTGSTIGFVLGKELLDTKVQKIVNPLDIDWFKAGWDAWTSHSNKKT